MSLLLQSIIRRRGRRGELESMKIIFNGKEGPRRFTSTSKEWFYKKKENPHTFSSQVLGPFPENQMKIWTEAGVLSNVVVSQSKEGDYVELSSTSTFKDHIGTPAEPKPTRWQRTKALWKEHGMVFIMYYGTLRTIPFVPIFGMLHSGSIDCIELLKYFHVDKAFDLDLLNPTVLNILVATECNEMLDFVRLPFVIATTPYVSRYLRRRRGKK